ncbi:MAG: hypothetical protein ACI865_000206 [Flavobacteriaceae bacterium]|jgi:hypothetical protein
MLKSLKNSMLKKFINLVISLFATGAASADSIPLKILFIGNSYTHMNDMPKMFDKIASKAGLNVIVEQSAQSSATFQIHSERREMFEAINKRKWDYIILQGFSRELSYQPEYIDTATVPYLSKITDSIYLNNPCTNVLFYMTWGYESGYEYRPEVDSYDKMADSIERGYRYIGEKYNVPVVPVGMVWKEVRKTTEIDLYDKDRAHPSSRGSYLIANTFFESIFGISADENLSIVKERDASEIREVVSSVLNEKRNDYKLDRFQIGLEPRVITKEDTASLVKEEEYEVEFIANYPEAESIMWVFEDGFTSSEWTGIYKLMASVDQNVAVHIVDKCGQTHIYNRKVVFISPENRRRRRREERRARKNKD